eukprot:TRINITY_DN80709_c0_g1_i1.p2 TRINITY_DN80709_c0_g1~~TRINITY_DN80709_c0_g1_i1.p2  ORF type:complete len:120 (+),score=17.17 TRINITY_DN80709_c0_g1_i1:43-402(+)
MPQISFNFIAVKRRRAVVALMSVAAVTLLLLSAALLSQVAGSMNPGDLNAGGLPTCGRFGNDTLHGGREEQLAISSVVPFSTLPRTLPGSCHIGTVFVCGVVGGSVGGVLETLGLWMIV